MWQRLLKYLKKSNSHLRPDEYVTQTGHGRQISRQNSARKISRQNMGDFNMSIAALFISMSRELSTAKPGSYFASFNGTSSVKPSHIEHIFLQ
jgi:hypothetical protein